MHKPTNQGRPHGRDIYTEMKLAFKRHEAALRNQDYEEARDALERYQWLAALEREERRKSRLRQFASLLPRIHGGHHGS